MNPFCLKTRRVLELERADPADEGQEERWVEAEDRSRRPMLLIKKSEFHQFSSFVFVLFCPDVRLAFSLVSLPLQGG